VRFIRRHWYNVGLVLGVLTLAWAFVGHFTTIQFILLLNFAVLTVHQFEEYGWPGGFPRIMNEGVLPKGGPADRYVLNQNNALWVNAIIGWPFYLIPVFFPDVIWLGLAPTLFGFGQFGFHGLFVNSKLKSFYNPGLATVVLGHLPIGIWYLVELYSQGAIPLLDWGLALIYTASFVVVGMFFIGFHVLADKNSPYPFTSEEMKRFRHQIESQIAR